MKIEPIKINQVSVRKGKRIFILTGKAICGKCGHGYFPRIIKNSPVPHKRRKDYTCPNCGLK